MDLVCGSCPPLNCRSLVPLANGHCHYGLLINELIIETVDKDLRTSRTIVCRHLNQWCNDNVVYIVIVIYISTSRGLAIDSCMPQLCGFLRFSSSAFSGHFDITAILHLDTDFLSLWDAVENSLWPNTVSFTIEMGPAVNINTDWRILFRAQRTYFNF